MRLPTGSLNVFHFAPIMATQTQLEPFVVSPDDPLADAHAAVAAWIEERGGNWIYQEVALSKLPGAQKLLKAKPPELRRCLLAALVQARHAARLKEQNKTYLPTMVYHSNASAVVEALLRRELPLESDDLVAAIEWCIDNCGNHYQSVKSLVHAIERYVSQTTPDERLLAGMKRFAAVIRSGWRESAAKLDELCAAATKSDTAVRDTPKCPPPAPAPVGMQGVLQRLKTWFGMSVDDKPPDSTGVGPDNFPLPPNSPLEREHELLNTLLPLSSLQADAAKGRLMSVPEFASLTAEAKGKLVLAAAERHACGLMTMADWSERRVWCAYASTIVDVLLPFDWQLPRDGLFDALLYTAIRPRYGWFGKVEYDDIYRLLPKVEAAAALSPLTDGERFVLSLVRAALIAYPPLDTPAAEVFRLSRLINDGACLCLVPGDAWSEAVNGDLTRAGSGERLAWLALFRHMRTATASKPTSKWLEAAKPLVEVLGGEKVAHALARWFDLVDRPSPIPRLAGDIKDLQSARAMLIDENMVCLKGLLWLAPVLPCREDLLRPIGAAALSASKKLPRIGARAIKIGNAAIYALSQMASKEAVGQLAMLKTRVKFGTAQKEIEKAFNAAAAALNLPRDEIEELGVPSYGLAEVGRTTETFGDYRAELVVNGSDAALHWFDGNGKALKSVPAKVKQEHKDDLKELQQSLKDIQAMLPAQRDRIDSMFLAQKSWPFAVWQERYLDHPLVGTIVRRLIWCVDGTPALFLDGQAADVRGEMVKHGETAEIALWHPVGRAIGEVVAWRERLEQLGVTQPFKQAHREVYLLTDAERRTNTYSNRFAAHVLRQHQFNALCAARGWKNKLRLMVDDTYPPASKELPHWGLRAEYWIEGIGEDFGRDTNETGTYLRLSTDQVRFYRIGAAPTSADAIGGGYHTRAAGPGTDRINEPWPLEQVPPLVFSEIMRDVDLFVGVSSVGNDPTWQDGGPQGRYQTYWQSFAFGELSGSAATRKQVLERLVPRLKIAAQCSFSDRFLVVRGKKRTYKIHLGSGNILMEPNDQYLCIVPDARARAAQGDLFLPFEGDNMLSIILSKALLLADDEKIKDPTITRQISSP